MKRGTAAGTCPGLGIPYPTSILSGSSHPREACRSAIRPDGDVGEGNETPRHQARRAHQLGKDKETHA